ncbi:MAG: hypothetical protein SFU56_13075, partial [Capsulimonadales bacterium]|nr:hypothetical protein [Capsulimonadales bacterium]
AFPLSADDPRRAAGVRVGPLTLIANLTHQPITVTVPFTGTTAHARFLDERNVVEACARPGPFLISAGTYLLSEQGRINVSLLPYAVACLKEP